MLHNENICHLLNVARYRHPKVKNEYFETSSLNTLKFVFPIKPTLDISMT